MNSDILGKLDEIIDLLDNSDDLKKFKDLKKKLLNDNELMNKISLIKSDALAYGEEYVELKKNILFNEDFSFYKDNETELYFLVKEINDKLKKILKGDFCEDN